MGARPGAGRKKTALKDKVAAGNPGGRGLAVLDIPEMEGVEMPKPHEFLSSEQRDGNPPAGEGNLHRNMEWLQKNQLRGQGRAGAH